MIAGETIDMNEFPLRCLYIGLFMRMFLACHITCHICDETLPAAPPKYILLLYASVLGRV